MQIEEDLWQGRFENIKLNLFVDSEAYAVRRFQSCSTFSAVTASSTNVFSSPVFTHLNKSLYLGV
jgi:hypothetical protein